MISINRLPIEITPSSRRTLVRPFISGNPSHVEHILFRIFSTPQDKIKKCLDRIYKKLDANDGNLKQIFLNHYEHVKHRIPSNVNLSDIQKEFIGSFFTQQYSLESTALFNPSIVPHPVQDKEGVFRFIISLRAIGEGHISSITFMEGEFGDNDTIRLQSNDATLIYEPERIQHSYEKSLFIKKANELGVLSGNNKPLFDLLPEIFTLSELEAAINKMIRSNVNNNKAELEESLNKIRLIALSNFSLRFNTPDLSQRAIYPASPSQSNGLEDARFVKFIDDDGTFVYFATFTAYDGKTIMPEMLETYDFNEFKISTLNGPAAKNKGLALFPRKVNGSYMMLGRQDNEALYLMTSDNPYFWYDSQPLIKPTYSWEYIQIGNCGSPIEIDEGWLVLTHGVGPLRTYSLGAMLLDKSEPWRVLGRLEEPLLQPTGEESSGYVPNVVYTCGALALGRKLLLPYAMGDVKTSFCTLSIDELLRAMK
ncbi:MAG: glycoside hydrolase family 130 protein [Bacteroidales bacterium]